MSLLSDLTFKRDDDLSQSELNRRARVVAEAIEALRAFTPDWKAEVDALREVGLERIDAALRPAYEQVIELANLGAMLSARSTSTVEIGLGAKSFIIPENKRDSFAPTPFLMVAADNDYDLAMVGILSSYDRESGVLVITVERTVGSGTYSNWSIGPIATTDDLEALRDQAQADAATASTKAAEAIAARDAAENHKTAAQTARTGAETAKTGADAVLADLNTKWYMARNTAPEGAPIGAMYLDTSTTPNVVKVLTETGWNPAVTVSVGGARQQVYVATEGQTGPFVVDGGFSSGFVYVNGVMLADGHGVAFDLETGSFTLDEARAAGDLIVFSGYLANDATDIFTKSEADNRFVSPKFAQAFSEAEKGRVKANLGVRSDSEFYNHLINGDFSIWQRTGGAGVNIGPGNNLYGPDRWSFRGISNTGGSIYAGRVQGAVSGAWSGRSRMNIARTGVTSNQYILQRVENLRQFSGKTLSVGMLMVVDTEEAIEININGSFGTGGTPSPDEAFTTQPILVPATTPFWVTHVFEMPDLSEKSFGTNEDDHLIVFFTFTGRDDKTLRMSQAFLVEGAIDEASLPLKPRHPQQELSLCQRYYEKTYSQNHAPGALVSEGSGLTVSSQEGSSVVKRTAASVHWQFSVKKRVTPSITTFSLGSGATGKMSDVDGGGDVNSEVVNPGQSGAIIRPANGVYVTDGARYSVHAVADAEI